MKSFFFFFLRCWNVVRWERWERHKHTTDQPDISLHYCIQEWQQREGGLNQTKEDMYNQETARRPSYDPQRQTPHTLASFFIGFSFISLNIQIIRTILSCQIKKIYRGSLVFFHYQKRYVNTFRENKQQLKIRASI